MQTSPSESNLWRLVERYPHLFSLLLALRNRLTRLTSNRLALIALIATPLILLGAIAVISYAFGAQRINEWAQYVEAHGSWLMLVAALQAATTVARRRKELTASLRDSWLASTPRSKQTFRSALFFGVIAAPVGQFAIVIVLLLLLEFAGRGDAAVLNHLMSITAGGALGGILLGFAFSTKQAHALPGSRYVPGKKSNVLPTTTASLVALSRWPVARAFAWANPDTLRWPLMAAMLSVMAGASVANGLGVVGFWMLILYMVTLCNSTLRVANEAAYWLQATPLSFNRFAAAIGGRSLLHQCIATAIMAAYLIFDKLTVLQAAVFVSPWMAFVVVAYGTAIRYAFASREGRRLSVAMSAAVLAVAEALHRGAALPTALLICGWQLRAGATARVNKGAANANG